MAADSKHRIREFFEHNRDEVVGVAGHANNCPLATFYKHTFNWIYVSVNIHYIVHDNGKRVYRKGTKPWQHKFIHEVDGRYTQNGMNTITGEEAIQILEEI